MTQKLDLLIKIHADMSVHNISSDVMKYYKIR